MHQSFKQTYILNVYCKIILKGHIHEIKAKYLF